MYKYPCIKYFPSCHSSLTLEISSKPRVGAPLAGKFYMYFRKSSQLRSRLFLFSTEWRMLWKRHTGFLTVISYSTFFLWYRIFNSVYPAVGRMSELRDEMFLICFSVVIMKSVHSFGQKNIKKYFAKENVASDFMNNSIKYSFLQWSRGVVYKHTHNIYLIPIEVSSKQNLSNKQKKT